MHITRHGFNFEIHILSEYDDDTTHASFHSPIGDIQLTLTRSTTDWLYLSITQNIGTFTLKRIEPSCEELGQSQKDVPKTLRGVIVRGATHTISLLPCKTINLNPEQKLSRIFVNHLENNKFIDITLESTDGMRQIHAHRALLAYYTPYFESALAFQASGSKLIIDNKEFQLYVWVMDFIYYGTIDETIDYKTMLELYKLAHYLDIKQMLFPVAWFVVNKFDSEQVDAIVQVIEWEPYLELQWEMCRKFNWEPEEKFKGHAGILYILLCHKQEIQNKHSSK